MTLYTTPNIYQQTFHKISQIIYHVKLNTYITQRQSDHKLQLTL
jgi:hypothetical protein